MAHPRHTTGAKKKTPVCSSTRSAKSPIVLILLAALVAATVPLVAQPVPAAAEERTAGRYVPLTSTRILDTRNGTGGITGAVGPGGTIEVTVAGRGGVPSSGVVAVALNVTVVPTDLRNGYGQVWPTGKARPWPASNLNWTNGAVIANLVVSELGTDGKASFHSSATYGSVDGSTTDVIFDVAGYYESTSGAGYVPLTPSRVVDTRSALGGFTGPLGPGQTASFKVTGVGGVPTSAVSTVAFNLTVSEPTATGYTTVFPTGEALPSTSNLSFGAGETRSLLVMAKVGAGGMVSVYNPVGSVHLLFDVEGYYTTGEGSRLWPVTASRIVDTRDGTGGLATLSAGQTVEVALTGVAGVPTSRVDAVLVNLTATDATADSYLSVWPAGEAQPGVTTVSFNAYRDTANLVMAKVGANGRVKIFNAAGSTNVVVDVFGYFALPPAAPTPLAPADGAVVDTLVPTLQVQDQGVASYQFKITAPGHPDVTSPWVTTPSWTVPMGVLPDGGDFGWHALAKSTEGLVSPPSASRKLKVDAQHLGDRAYYPMVGLSMGASVNAANGNLVVSHSDVSLPTVNDPFVISRTYNSRAGKPLYVDDAVPYNATQAGSWVWDAARKWSGAQSHKEPTAAGVHQHSFQGAQARQFVPYGSTLVTYAYLDPTSAPREVMLQFWLGDGSQWDHRAYWGENLIAWGTDGTASRRRLGDLPATGQWVRLEVPASEVGLEGKVVAGMAYTLYDGQAWFDKSYLGGTPVGHGWTLSSDLAMAERSYTTLMERTDNAHVEVTGSNGAGHFFYPTGTANQYGSTSGDFAVVTKTANEWRLETVEGFVYSFDLASGRLRTVRIPERDDRMGFTHTYNAAGQLMAIEDVIGRKLILEYDAERRLERIRADFDQNRVLATYGYDGQDQLTSVTDASGRRSEYTYDPVSHDLLSITSPRGTETATVGDFRATIDYQDQLAGEEYRRVSALRRPHTEAGSTTELKTSLAYTPATRTSKVTSPRGTATTSDPNDFVTTYV